MDSHTLSAGLRGEYKIATDVVDIIPHIGVRLTSVHTDSYSLGNNFGPVVQGDAADATIWTFPIGLTFTKNFETNSGWNVQPLLDLNITPAAGDVDINNNIRFTGINTNSVMKS